MTIIKFKIFIILYPFFDVFINLSAILQITLVSDTDHINSAFKFYEFVGSGIRFCYPIISNPNPVHFIPFKPSQIGSIVRRRGLHQVFINMKPTKNTIGRIKTGRYCFKFGDFKYPYTI